MNVIVIGSVPPPLGGRRDSLLSEALALSAEGHDVEILAPGTLGAAHRYLATTGLGAALEIGFAARRAGSVVVQLEPGLPVRAQAGRAERAASLLALRVALQRTPEVVLRLDHLDDLPGGPGGRAALELWKAADRIEVGDEQAHAQLAGLLGPLGVRVHLASVREQSFGPVAASLAPSSPSEWGDGADATADAVTEVVRRRAATERAALAQRRQPGRHQEARVPLWQWLPWPGGGVPPLGPPGRSAGSGPGVRAPTGLRRVAVRILAATERRPATRPLARLARRTWQLARSPLS